MTHPLLMCGHSVLFCTCKTLVHNPLEFVVLMKFHLRLVCGQPPFQEANDSETLTMIMDCKYTMPSHVSPGCRKLISSMLVREPEKRATIDVSRVIKLSFFKRANCETLVNFSKLRMTAGSWRVSKLNPNTCHS
jgi:serine/threonine protein kinase